MTCWMRRGSAFACLHAAKLLCTSAIYEVDCVISDIAMLAIDGFAATFSSALSEDRSVAYLLESLSTEKGCLRPQIRSCAFRRVGE